MFLNKESQSQQARGYSLSLQLGTKKYRSKLRGIRPNWSNKNKLISLCMPCKVNVLEDNGKVKIISMN